MTREYVWILVWVEHTLGVWWAYVHAVWGLNPCFSGTYSRREYNAIAGRKFEGLNPCFSGTYSRRWKRKNLLLVFLSLNPCFSGTYSRRLTLLTREKRERSLNPCFSGTYSRSGREQPVCANTAVLILVLVEHTLGECSLWDLNRYQTEVLILVLVEHTLGAMRRVSWSRLRPQVLILVLVEHTLGAVKMNTQNGLVGLNPCFSGTYSRSVSVLLASVQGRSLNPCFSGTYSRRNMGWTKTKLRMVLILVLVEHTLGVLYSFLGAPVEDVLILVLVEHTLGAC